MKRPHKIWVLIVGLLLIVAAVFLIFKPESKHNLKYPAYLNFTNSYIFSMPSGYTVDDRSFPEILVVYPGSFEAKTLDDIYNNGGITVQPLAQIKGDFKGYVNNTVATDLKKNLSADAAVTFLKSNGDEAAKITVTKDGQTIRYVFVKNGQHPLSVTAKNQGSQVDQIDGSVDDVESTELAKQVSSLKSSLSHVSDLIRKQDGDTLFKEADQELTSKTSANTLSNNLKNSAQFAVGDSKAKGGIFGTGADDFGAVVTYMPLAGTNTPVPWALFFKDVNGSWKLKGISYPVAPSTTTSQ